ncbi:protein TolQ [Candidatus Halobeggiatoa sp. HSG11]|nr:protein TolQ [Candidatus Halobeggiatoa sp. HSG11]
MNELSLIKLILEASLLVQMVMLLLLFISLYSWTLIFYKSRYLKNIHNTVNDFEELFWRSKDLHILYNHIRSNQAVGIEKIFVAGYAEFVKSRSNAETLVANAKRAMQIVLRREIDELESELAALATIGSVSPYIGLFGTVWGIMTSFHALGDQQQVTLAMIAPGISEALIATAMGLFVAIPAVMAYNHYTDDIDRLITSYDTFLDEFLGILQRKAQNELS